MYEHRYASGARGRGGSRECDRYLREFGLLVHYADTSPNQLRLAGGALGDFFGPGTTVGIPFAGQVVSVSTSNARLRGVRSI